MLGALFGIRNYMKRGHKTFPRLCTPKDSTIITPSSRLIGRQLDALTFAVAHGARRVRGNQFITIGISFAILFAIWKRSAVEICINASESGCAGMDSLSLTAFIIGAAVASALDGTTASLVLATGRGFGHPKSILQALAYKQFEWSATRRIVCHLVFGCGWRYGISFRLLPCGCCCSGDAEDGDSVELAARPWNPPTLPPLELLDRMLGVTATVTTAEDALLLSMAGTAKK